MRTSGWAILLWACVAACASEPGDGGDGDGDGPVEHGHDPRFVGLWVVAQPFHALYEQTYYRFEADGALITGASIPADCTGHLDPHCVTGSVANCVPAPDGSRCSADLTCVFGATWHSLDATTVVIAGDCSDERARDIQLRLAADAAIETEIGGDATVLAVGGEAGWSHDNWEWTFRKCPAGTDESTCSPGF